MKHLLILLFFFGLAAVPGLCSENAVQQADTSYVLRGRVLGGDTNKPLVNASITVQQVNVSSVTNQDGYFSLRVPASTINSQLIIHHLGYENKKIPLITLINSPNNHIIMDPSPIELSEVEVIGGDGTNLVREALRRIPENYPAEPNMMVAFYREWVKKGSNYISLVETVLDVYKASYRSYSNDQARIYIGRKATDISPRDTVLLKYQGGIHDALMLDIAKNPEIVFGTDASELSLSY